MSFILQPVCNYSDCIWNMAVPVGITALSSNNNVIQKASTKHYLHNILLSYTKAVFITVSPHHWYLQKKRSNVIIIKKNYYWKHRETKTPFKQVRKQIRGNYRNTHTCAHTRCKSLMRENHLHVRMVLPGVGEGPQCWELCHSLVHRFS